MYVCEISTEQASDLRALMETEGSWEFDSAQYALWRGRRGKLSVTAYCSGKLVIQGKGTGDFVRFTLEPNILKQARFGYEDVWAQIENKDMFEKHAGVGANRATVVPFAPMVRAAWST